MVPTEQPSVVANVSSVMDREAFFHGAGRAGARPKIHRAGKTSKSAGRGTYCVYQLIEIICYCKGNINLHCIKRSKPNILNIHTLDRIHN